MKKMKERQTKKKPYQKPIIKYQAAIETRAGFCYQSVGCQFQIS